MVHCRRSRDRILKLCQIMPHQVEVIDLVGSSPTKERTALRDVSNKISKTDDETNKNEEDPIIDRDNVNKSSKTTIRTRCSTRILRRSKVGCVTEATETASSSQITKQVTLDESHMDASEVPQDIDASRKSRYLLRSSKVESLSDNGEPISKRTRLKRRRSTDQPEETTESNANQSDQINAISSTRINANYAESQQLKKRKKDAVSRRKSGSSAFEEIGKKVVFEHGCIVPTHFRLQRHDHDNQEHTLGIAPHDSKDVNSIIQSSTYVTDIVQNLYEAEHLSRPRLYMDKQTDINGKMRAILVDWLVEVHLKFRLVPETLHLSINIIDRYCSLVAIKRSKLQLVGVTALLLACKYEEIYPPEVRDCVYITDKAYERQDVLDMEQDIVNRLRFKITVPTAYPFLQRFLNIIPTTKLVKFATNYYTERTLQEHDMLVFKPSLISASSLVLALNNPDLREKDEEVNTVPTGIVSEVGRNPDILS